MTGALLPRPRKHGRLVLRSECACLRAVSHYSAPYVPLFALSVPLFALSVPVCALCAPACFLRGSVFACAKGKAVLSRAEFYQTHFMDSHTTRELTTMVFSPLLKGEPLKDSDLFVGNTTFRRAVLCRCSIHPRHPNLQPPAHSVRARPAGRARRAAVAAVLCLGPPFWCTSVSRATLRPSTQAGISW